MDAIDGKKRESRCESGTLVRVEEGMVLRQALPKSAGFLDDIDVTPGFRPKQRCFQMSRTPNSRPAAIAGYLIRVHRKNFGQGKVVRHLASFR